MINTNKLKARIVELGYTQKDGADCIGVAQPTFSQKINNIRPMDVDEADKLAIWLCIPNNEYGDYFFYHPVA
jgi:transcriptional regulator with XRE-family HTH domain